MKPPSLQAATVTTATGTTATATMTATATASTASTSASDVAIADMKSILSPTMSKSMSMSTSMSTSTSNSTPTNCSFIKPSLSMTSLPPNSGHLDGTDVIKAKLKFERPYNSLKKKRNPDRDIWRHSWGSGHSHSSCSLHSNATGVGLLSGKDEFWAALQTNYNYIMDTNLLDTCKEARCEIEGAASTVSNTPNCCEKSLMQSSPTQESAEDPRVLRRWIREMEEKLSMAPSLSEATQMNVAELQRRLAEHSVLYCEIVSHARVVGACVRASEKENENQTSTEEKPSASTNGGSKRFDGNLKGLEHRYHLLYLKAIEIQCLFEGLLGKKNSSSVLSRASSTDTDEEPAAKLARLSDSETNTHASCDLLSVDQTISDENKSEDEDWPDLSYDSTLHISNDSNQEVNENFDADSEGSDCDVVIYKDNNRYANNKGFYIKNGKNRKDESVLSENMDSNSCYYTNKKNSSLEFGKKKLLFSSKLNNFVNANNIGGSINNINSNSNNIGHHNCNPIENGIKIKTNSNANLNGNIIGNGNVIGGDCTCNCCCSCSNSNSNCKSNQIHSNKSSSSFCCSSSDINIGGHSPKSGLSGGLATTGGSAKKRQRGQVDISKFNRSNRKSKNCAIFYFKHLDTDNENFGLSSQGSDALKSGEEPSSDDEGWLYTNDCVDGHITVLNGSGDCLTSGDSDKENKDLDSTLKVNEIKMTTNINCLSKDLVDSSILNENCIAISEAGCSHESIKQLVLDAEMMVRDEVLRAPTTKRHSIDNSPRNKKREMHHTSPNIQRVQEWLEHQPIMMKDGATATSQPTTDCEASGEYTESDSPARESDTSEGFTDSMATCMQTESNSQCTSTEIIGGSAEPIITGGSNPNLGSGKVVRRTNRRNSDRPWSVSCLSQLTEVDNIIDPTTKCVNQRLASHSISESALNMLSTPEHRPEEATENPVKSADSKSSLKRRKTRRRRHAGKKSDSGSDGILPFDLPKITQNIIKSESLSGQMHIIQDLTMALSMLSLPKSKSQENKSTSEHESEEDVKLTKPTFKLGSFTTAFMSSESKLGSLAALANYMNDDQGEYHTGTEDHSSFSEQAWDNYQEKYNSENYSEGMDSDAARRLLEFGDDYRNFLDSQSDCCSSSLSAANNFDSLSPPRMDSLKPVEVKLPAQVINSSVDHIRRRRALELEYERRRKPSELKKKSSQDDIYNGRRTNGNSSPSNQSSPKTPNKLMNRSYSDVVGRKLDYVNNNSATSFRKNSESDNSIRRRKSEDGSTVRRRSSRTMDKSFKVIPPTSSSSNDDSDDEKEMKNLLVQSRNRLENTNALKIRSHLLRPEDYAEIIATCRDNIRCLESLVRGTPGSILSPVRSNDIRDLLSSWESLLDWSENAASARKMQEEMIVLKNALNRLGKQTCDFDSDESIQYAIEELKNEKVQLQTCRTNMLRLNASVHSWLTRQEIKLSKELEHNNNGAAAGTGLIDENGVIISNNNNNNNINNIINNNNNIIIDDNAQHLQQQQQKINEKNYQISTVGYAECELHKQLKDEVSDMYSAWDDADVRITHHLEVLNKSWVAWRQLECGLSEFHQVLGKDRGTLKGLEGALERGKITSLEIAQNVKQVAKLLSEKVECSHHQISNASQENNSQEESNRLTPIQFSGMVTPSNGSLSDSGISDGGATSDGGLSERERRLGVLRRLAKQLENALAPGSEALKSIAARMEAAEAELKTLQNTCRELIVRTAVSQHKKSQALLSQKSMNANGAVMGEHRMKTKKSPSSGKRKNKRRSSVGSTNELQQLRNQRKPAKEFVVTAPDFGDPDDPSDDCLDICTSDDDDFASKSGWAWRVARIAFPVQIALLTLFCAACLMEPHCCDSLNNFSMSFTPQLRYVRGPPPI